MSDIATTQHTLINDYLQVLGVSHTENFCNEQVSKMPFKTLYGLTRLLETFGVDSQGWMLNDKTEIGKLPVPFLASTPEGIVIVTGVSDHHVTYMSQGVTERAPMDVFLGSWDGRAVVSTLRPEAAEPDYKKHRRIETANHWKGYVMWAGIAALVIYLVVTNSLYRFPSVIIAILLDMAGLFFTYLLVKKSLNLHSTTADRFCKVIQEGGCDNILASDASKFFGLFGWSEVGFAYFSVSLAATLLLPHLLPWLALCNLICLPYSFWSVWYQRFRAHHWCTLCLSVQTTLWLLFFSYLAGGWIKQAWPLSPSFFALGVCYVTVMLAINGVMNLIERK